MWRARARRQARPLPPRPYSRDSPAPGGAGPRQAGANAFRRSPPCVSAVFSRQRCHMTTSSPWLRGLGVARRGGRPRPLFGGVGQGAGDRERGRLSLASRYLHSPPPTEASLGNVSRPEHCPASLPIPREMRPIKVVFPPFSGWGRGEELGNWSAWSWTWGLDCRVRTGCFLCAVRTEKFSGFKIVTSPLLPTFEMLSILFTLQRIVPQAYKSWMGWCWKLVDSKQCCLYVMLFACDDSELFGVNIGVKMINIVYSFSWLLLQRTILHLSR